MKFSIDKGLLLEVLANLVGVATKKNANIPILQNIKIEITAGELILTATDLDTTVKNNINIIADSEGATTVPAQMLFDIVKKMNDGSEIVIEYNDDNSVLFVSSGRSKFKLPCLDCASFPIIEEIDMEQECVIPTIDFISIIDKTRFAISLDEARYYLNGLFFHTKEVEGQHYFAGTTTDGHKLGFVKRPQVGNPCDLKGVIIPKKALIEIRKLLETPDEEISLAFSKTKIKVKTTHSTLISKLIDAEFPDYERVIPYANKHLLTVDKKELTSAIDRVSTIVSDKNKGIKFLISGNSLKLIADTPDAGYADEEVKINYEGPDLDIGLNSKYALELLSQIESDMVSMKFSDNNTPAIVQGTEELNNLFIIMPMKV